MKNKNMTVGITMAAISLLGIITLLVTKHYSWIPVVILAFIIAAEIALFLLKAKNVKTQEASKFVHYCQFKKGQLILFPILLLGTTLSIITIHDEYFSSDATYMRNELTTVLETDVADELFSESSLNKTIKNTSEIISKTEAIALCSGYRLVGIMQDTANILVVYSETETIPESASTFSAPMTYNGNNKLLKLYEETFSINWIDIVNQTLEGNPTVANPIEENVTVLLNEAKTSIIWSSVFTKYGPFIFFPTLLSYLMRFGALSILKKPIIRKTIQKEENCHD